MNLQDQREREADFLFREGKRYQQVSDLGKALDFFRRVVELDADFAPAHHGLGDVLAKMGRWFEAGEAYREVIRLRPEDGQAYLNLGFVYYEMGLDEEAQVAFERAKTLGGLAKHAAKMRF